MEILWENHWNDGDLFLDELDAWGKSINDKVVAKKEIKMGERDVDEKCFSAKNWFF